MTEKGNAEISALKDRQSVQVEKILKQGDEVSLDEILRQVEVKLYQNRIMEWVMPFLEYITLGVGILLVIVGIILFAPVMNGYQRFFLAIFYGITLATPLFYLAGLLGMIKRNHIFVLSVLGLEFFAELVLRVAGWQSSDIVDILFLAGVIIWYVFTFVIKYNFGAEREDSIPNVQRHRVVTENEEMSVSGDKHFCSQCGAEYKGQISFCPKCGERVG